MPSTFIGSRRIGSSQSLTLGFEHFSLLSAAGPDGRCASTIPAGVPGAVPNRLGDARFRRHGLYLIRVMLKAAGRPERGGRSRDAGFGLRDALGVEQRLAERLKQRAVDRVALGIILGMPLDAERKATAPPQFEWPRSCRPPPPPPPRPAAPGSRMPWPCSELTRMVSHAEQSAKAPPGSRLTSWRSAKTTVGSGWISPFSSRGIRWFMRPGNSRISGCSEPPKATFISCRPRQMPNSGMPRATQVSDKASATSSRRRS